MNFSKTGLSRVKAFWFCLITPFLIVLSSFIFEVNADVITSYFMLCFTVITAILGSKANDTIQNFKNNTGDMKK